MAAQATGPEQSPRARQLSPLTKENPMKVTRHTDGTVSLRLRRHGDGTDTPSLEDIVFALGQAALGFDLMVQKYPGDAADYARLAGHHRRLARDIEAGAQR